MPLDSEDFFASKVRLEATRQLSGLFRDVSGLAYLDAPRVLFHTAFTFFAADSTAHVFRCTLFWIGTGMSERRRPRKISAGDNPSDHTVCLRAIWRVREAVFGGFGFLPSGN